MKVLADLNLEDYWVDELAYREVSRKPTDAPRGTSRPLPQIEVSVAPVAGEDGQESWIVDLYVAAGPARAAKGIPYEFRVRVNGVFTVASGVPDAAKYRLIHMNGPAILYGIARGAVGTVTGLGRNSKYILPPVNLVEVLNRQRRRKQRVLEKMAPIVE